MIYYIPQEFRTLKVDTSERIKGPKTWLVHHVTRRNWVTREIAKFNSHLSWRFCKISSFSLYHICIAEVSCFKVSFFSCQRCFNVFGRDCLVFGTLRCLLLDYIGISEFELTNSRVLVLLLDWCRLRCSSQWQLLTHTPKSTIDDVPEQWGIRHWSVEIFYAEYPRPAPFSSYLRKGAPTTW